jgi:hypothetical protein
MNRDAYMFLQLLYQMNEEGRKYKSKAMPSTRVTATVGDDPFCLLSREEMVARTNIQSQAMTFSIDKLNEKREDLALAQFIAMHPIAGKRVESVHEVGRHVVKGWSKKWKNIVDRVFPSLDQIKKEEIMLAVQGVAAYVQNKQAESEVTGQPMPVETEGLLQAVRQMTAQMTMTPEEVAKNAEKSV